MHIDVKLSDKIIPITDGKILWFQSPSTYLEKHCTQLRHPVLVIRAEHVTHQIAAPFHVYNKALVVLGADPQALDIL